MNRAEYVVYRIGRIQQRLPRIEFCLERNAPIDEKRSEELKMEQAALQEELAALQAEQV